MREVTQFSKKIFVRVNLGENSEVFNSEFLVLSIEQNGKLGVEKPRKTDSLRSSVPENAEFSTLPKSDGELMKCQNLTSHCFPLYSFVL